MARNGTVRKWGNALPLFYSRVPRFRMLMFIHLPSSNVAGACTAKLVPARKQQQRPQRQQFSVCVCFRLNYFGDSPYQGERCSTLCGVFRGQHMFGVYFVQLEPTRVAQEGEGGSSFYWGGGGSCRSTHRRGKEVVPGGDYIRFYPIVVLRRPLRREVSHLRFHSFRDSAWGQLKLIICQMCLS